MDATQLEKQRQEPLDLPSVASKYLFNATWVFHEACDAFQTCVEKQSACLTRQSGLESDVKQHVKTAREVLQTLLSTFKTINISLSQMHVLALSQRNVESRPQGSIFFPWRLPMKHLWLHPDDFTASISARQALDCDGYVLAARQHAKFVYDKTNAFLARAAVDCIEAAVGINAVPLGVLAACGLWEAIPRVVDNIEVVDEEAIARNLLEFAEIVEAIQCNDAAKVPPPELPPDVFSAAFVRLAKRFCTATGELTTSCLVAAAALRAITSCVPCSSDAVVTPQWAQDTRADVEDLVADLVAPSVNLTRRCAVIVCQALQFPRAVGRNLYRVIYRIMKEFGFDEMIQIAACNAFGNDLLLAWECEIQCDHYDIIAAAADRFPSSQQMQIAACSALARLMLRNLDRVLLRPYTKQFEIKSVKRAGFIRQHWKNSAEIARVSCDIISKLVFCPAAVKLTGVLMGYEEVFHALNLSSGNWILSAAALEALWNLSRHFRRTCKPAVQIRSCAFRLIEFNRIKILKGRKNVLVKQGAFAALKVLQVMVMMSLTTLCTIDIGRLQQCTVDFIEKVCTVVDCRRISFSALVDVVDSIAVVPTKTRSVKLPVVWMSEARATKRVLKRSLYHACQILDGKGSKRSQTPFPPVVVLRAFKVFAELVLWDAYFRRSRKRMKLVLRRVTTALEAMKDGRFPECSVYILQCFGYLVKQEPWYATRQGFVAVLALTVPDDNICHNAAVTNAAHAVILHFWPRESLAEHLTCALDLWGAAVKCPGWEATCVRSVSSIVSMAKQEHCGVVHDVIMYAIPRAWYQCCNIAAVMTENVEMLPCVEALIASDFIGRIMTHWLRLGRVKEHRCTELCCALANFAAVPGCAASMIKRGVLRDVIALGWMRVHPMDSGVGFKPLLAIVLNCLMGDDGIVHSEILGHCEEIVKFCNDVIVRALNDRCMPTIKVCACVLQRLGSAPFCGVVVATSSWRNVCHVACKLLESDASIRHSNQSVGGATAAVLHALAEFACIECVRGMMCESRELVQRIGACDVSFYVREACVALRQRLFWRCNDWELWQPSIPAVVQQGLIVFNSKGPHWPH